MPENNDKDVKDLLKKLKNSEHVEYPQLENRRKEFERRIFLQKFFIIIILILLTLICVISQGINF